MEQNTFSIPEEESRVSEVKASYVAPEGLGFGDGAISVNTRMNLQTDDQEYLPQSSQAKVISQILQAPATIMSEVDQDPATGNYLDDDGCGDGRGVLKVTLWRLKQGYEKTVSLVRAKIFGGASVMSGAALVATGDASPDTFDEMIYEGIAALKQAGIKYGAHTDNHAHGEKCGCGAIDNMPTIMQYSQKFRSEITDTLEQLNIPTNGVDTVFDRFAHATQTAADKPYSGRKVMDTIEADDGVVVKELDGSHRETIVVLNMMQHHTLDQQKIRELSDDRVQAFCVDVWRLLDITKRLFPDDEARQRSALQGMLIYTLATAAVLTKGDLPVLKVEAQEAPVAV